MEINDDNLDQKVCDFQITIEQMQNYIDGLNIDSKDRNHLFITLDNLLDNFRNIYSFLIKRDNLEQEIIDFKKSNFEFWEKDAERRREIFKREFPEEYRKIEESFKNISHEKLDELAKNNPPIYRTDEELRKLYHESKLANKNDDVFKNLPSYGVGEFPFEKDKK